MANGMATNDEELLQRGLLSNGTLQGRRFGDFEEFDIGNTYVGTLRKAGMGFVPPEKIEFPFKEYKMPQRPTRAKPDVVYALRRGGDLLPVAVKKLKGSTAIGEERARRRAAEQAIYEAAAMDCKFGIVTDGAKWRYIDVPASLGAGDIIELEERRDFQPGVLRDLVDGSAGQIKDPQPLADRVWQIIWMATKEEPKECLLTFVEIFIFKFLSDNLPVRDLPRSYSFYELTKSEQEFRNTHGMTTIQYDVSKVRPTIKQLFPDNTIASDPGVGAIFGLATVVSKDSQS